MGRIDPRYQMKTTPLAAEKAVVQGPDYRFTVLTPMLIRMEYAADGRFEDRATQTVVNRLFPVPEFTVTQEGEGVRILTACMELVYTGGPFAASSLTARYAGEMGGSGHRWHFGDRSCALPGTARTLDGVDASCPLEDSVLSVRDMAVLDDSRSLILAEDGWVDARGEGAADYYLFGYQTRYLEALRDYCRLTGETPLLPRYAFGNWWSRYHAYTQQEYLELMARFRKEGVPFSVAVIDMDWHPVKIDPRCGSGWTGFTWDKALFPDHRAMLQKLHEDGMEVSLNLHPAEGFGAHERCYEEMARRNGVDPATGAQVEFNVTDPKFLESYFDVALHPLEKEGVTFWWMDWQQGTTTRIPGLDPLWMLNHYHFMDQKRDGRRPMIFSRYAGYGSHRYPIGFSGDTFCTWDALRFQPYFTNCASNVAYGWWSHDIGGHMGGAWDDELSARWVQLGVFSPILRLHSTRNDFMSKEVWRYGMEARQSMTAFLRLRHRLVPYLYTMNERTHRECVPLVCPLYYDPRCGRNDLFYHAYRNEYFFGSEMLVSPITEKADPVTRRAAVKTYLPEGQWFDFFSGMAYAGGRACVNYRTLDAMPVFVKAGGIVPQDGGEVANRVDNPACLRLEVFPGADGAFTLYEDDGRTMACEEGHAARTAIRFTWGDTPTLTIAAPQGDASVIPADRRYVAAFRAITPAQVAVEGAEGWKAWYADGTQYVEAPMAAGDVTIRLHGARQSRFDYVAAINELLLQAQCENNFKQRFGAMTRSARTATELLSNLAASEAEPALKGALEEIILACADCFPQA